MGPTWVSGSLPGKLASPRLEKKSERTQRFLAGLEGLRRITTDSSCGETRLSLSFVSSGCDIGGGAVERSGGLVTTSGREEEDNSGVMVESVTKDKR